MRKLEEGASLSVSYEDIQQKRITKIFVISCVPIVLLLLGLIAIFTLIKPPVPQFMLDDLSVDPVSNSSLVVNLSSTNPSYTTDIYYSKMSVGVKIEGIFQTESVFLQSTLQKPHERTLWTAVVAINMTNGSLGMRDGLMKAGDVVAHVNILGKFGILKNSLLVTCPILNDLKAIISKPCQVI
ncbi:hypothetical protein Bca4012_036360 [Brassica carinata]|uniref:Late embryogenesis abundant protein LEA-2 subgroup domain-containing protein n=1 Tax=Brassica carinata TaxID=52824 RepID=A0A8X7WCJ8_BRACI|nr:hypothetical protein Bca52824_010079 [Brassica carinata]